MVTYFDLTCSRLGPRFVCDDGNTILFEIDVKIFDVLSFVIRSVVTNWRRFIFFPGVNGPHRLFPTRSSKNLLIVVLSSSKLFRNVCHVFLSHIIQELFSQSVRVFIRFGRYLLFLLIFLVRVIIKSMLIRVYEGGISLRLLVGASVQLVTTVFFKKSFSIMIDCVCNN